MKKQLGKTVVDLRIGNHFARLKKSNKVFESGDNVEDFYEIVDSFEIIVQPHEHVLMTTLEYIEFQMI